MAREHSSQVIKLLCTVRDMLSISFSVALGIFKLCYFLWHIVKKKCKKYFLSSIPAPVLKSYVAYIGTQSHILLYESIRKINSQSKYLIG